MDDAKTQFAERLREAMTAAGYEPKAAVLEREFNTRYWGKPMTLHGVRRWLQGETLPSQVFIFMVSFLLLSLLMTGTTCLSQCENG